MAVQHQPADTKPGCCTDCGDAIAEHIGGKPCVSGSNGPVSSLYDLPVAKWAWRGDARTLRA